MSPPAPGGTVATDAATESSGDPVASGVVDVLSEIEQGEVDPSEVSQAVEALLTVGIDADEATDLASSPAILDSIDSDQAAQIFEQIQVGDLSEEQEAGLVAAVTDAPTDVKNAFESEIDVYGSGLDEYVPVGSSIDVGSRRTLIAATTAVSTLASGVAATGSARTGGGPMSAPRDGGSSSGPTGEAAPIATHEEVARRQSKKMMMRRRGTGNLTRRIIRGKSGEGTGIMGEIRRIIRVILKEVTALSFTLAGSVIVFFTLSGQTRRIALVVTLVAVALHFINAIIESSSESHSNEQS